MHWEAPFYFQIRMKTGVVYYGTCSSKTTSGGVDTLTIGSLAAPFVNSDIDLFSIMFENRYAGDKFKITYTNYQIANLKTLTTGV